MGVYLYGVNIPEDNTLTIKIYPDGRATCDDGKYLTHVIITEVKPPHGRLIDTDTLARKIVESNYGVDFINKITILIMDTSTVIESEEGE